MFESIARFFKKLVKSEQQETKSKDTAKERLHLVLMQDRANVSADFLELMKQEIIEVIKKYIEVDDKAIDVRLTNKVEEDGTNGSPFLYANIPIVKIKNEEKPKAENEIKSDKDDDKKEVIDENKTESDNDLSENEEAEEIVDKIKEAEEIIEEVKPEEKDEDKAEDLKEGVKKEKDTKEKKKENTKKITKK